jgi:hypothetical protein
MKEGREKNLIPQRVTLTLDMPIASRILQWPLATARRKMAVASGAGEAAH